jgi:DNA-binding MarR family transcriptional regulator
MPKWSLWTNHARTLLLIARNPEARLRDLAGELGVTERTAYEIVSQLIEAGYLLKEKIGRRNRYRIQTDVPMPGSTNGRTLGEFLKVLGD